MNYVKTMPPPQIVVKKVRQATRNVSRLTGMGTPRLSHQQKRRGWGLSGASESKKHVGRGVEARIGGGGTGEQSSVNDVSGSAEAGADEDDDRATSKSKDS